MVEQNLTCFGMICLGLIQFEYTLPRVWFGTNKAIVDTHAVCHMSGFDGNCIVPRHKGIKEPDIWRQFVP